MKKIQILLLIAILLIVGNNKLKAQEDNVRPKTIIGATSGLQFSNGAYNRGFCSDVFYRRYITSVNRKAFYNNLYLNVNTGYTQYKSHNINRKEIPVTLGICGYTSDTEFIYFSTSIDFGVLYRMEERTFNESINNEPSNDTKFLASIMFNFVIPLSKTLNLDIVFRDHYIIKDLTNRKLSAGLSYHF